MHIQECQRHEWINQLKIRDELKQLFTGELRIGLFQSYFGSPACFYSQGSPDNPGNWLAFSDRTLLPLWQHEDRVYRTDINTTPIEVVSWHIECPDDRELIHSVDAAIFDMIVLHVWEYGGGKQEADEARLFAEQIALPCRSQLQALLANVESCTEEAIASYRNELWVLPRT